MRKLTTYILFVAACVAIGVLSGIANMPGEWYQALEKPPLNPPNWIFGPVWAALYVMIGTALAETWFDENNRNRLIVFGLQGIFNICWSPAFFGMQNPVLGLAIIVPMLFFILLFIAMSWNPNRKAALLFVPYAIWVSFATYLNLAIVLLNP
ncbi:tryptophan-rich sensory protein [Rhizobiales bacterium RZME27]|uniref:Tryptophan-rich sensory protein n=1 Tax=Endobacterium cereale TaxID=2663029 RepID=A0A6A8A2T3_9HYPH|nr:TspO/MBR family protein [Endobacterium cereale]MEB2844890.1 TspO/MBR family protein [Endobacterium cereale]MQY44804.1 tryptophan-rich sensory protein [Endobacterium cereale]